MYRTYAQAQTVLERSGKSLDEWMVTGTNKDGWNITRRPVAIDHEQAAADRNAREQAEERAMVEAMTKEFQALSEESQRRLGNPPL